MRSVWRAVGQTVSGALLLLALLVVPPPIALAQAAEPADGGAGRLSLAPAEARVQVTLNPGAAAEGDLRFSYDGTAAIAARLGVFESRLTPDGPRIVPPDSARSDSAARWISLNRTSVTLRPGDTETIHYRLQVPPAAPPGDHAALVTIEADPPGPRAAVRVIVSVPGETREQLSLVAFGAERQPLRVLGFAAPTSLPLYDGGPIELWATLRNDGTVLTTPSGQVELLDPAGNVVTRLDLPAEPLFPGDGAALRVPWASPPVIGIFTARLQLEGAGEPLADERLLVLPWQQVVAAILFVVALRLLLGGRLSLPLPGRAVDSDSGRAGVPSGAVEATPPDAAPGPSQPPPAGEAPEPTVALAVHPPNGVAAAADLCSDGVPRPALARELVQEGQRAAREGSRPVAYRLFARAVELDPANDVAWLWRAGTTEQVDEAIYCLEQVLRLHPDHVRARQGLDELRRRFAQPEASPAS